jgi:pimeloyl-ACP methyl ester carboxylesterase
MQANVRKWLFTAAFLMLFFAPSYSYEPYSEGGLKPPEWQPREMNASVGPKIEAELKPDSWLCGFFIDCKFDLHYFFGKDYDGPDGRTFNPKNNKPWILFIPGGPGDIVDRQLHYLDFLTPDANVVYFDVRGTGFSVLPESNDYDRFLRADYVVEDIETLRRALLNECSSSDRDKLDCKRGIKKWDAIYAHSWGTIVAQQYAARYPKMVRNLILSAPVSRGQLDTEQARRTMIVKNLFDIFDKHPTTTCSWNPKGSPPPEADKLIELGGPAPKVENFCFFKNQQKKDKEEVTHWSTEAILIKKTFSELLNSVEMEYGSVNLVSSFYDQFRSDRHFWEKHPYPKEFFRAIRELQDYGAGEQAGLQLDSTSRSRKVGTAMYLAYYLSLPTDALRDEKHPLYPGMGDSIPRCDKVDAPFFNGLPIFDTRNILKRNYCTRIQTAWLDLHRERPLSFNQSARARTVFSVYDGLARWIFEIMKNERRTDREGCFAGKDIQDIARGDAQLQAVVLNSAVIKEQAWRLGTKAGDRICPWDPARIDESGKCKYCLHGEERRVNTLILKGGADAITAGEQAEYLFEKALAPGHRALIEFPGLGHGMNHQLKQDVIKPDELDEAISNFKKIIKDDQTEHSVVYQTLIRGIEELKETAKDRKIYDAVYFNRRNIILSFLKSTTIRDFVQDTTAGDAMRNLGGCLRTEDTTEFSDCLCRLTKSEHPICKVDKKVLR